MGYKTARVYGHNGRLIGTRRIEVPYAAFPNKGILSNGKRVRKYEGKWCLI